MPHRWRAAVPRPVDKDALEPLGLGASAVRHGVQEAVPLIELSKVVLGCGDYALLLHREQQFGLGFPPLSRQHLFDDGEHAAPGRHDRSPRQRRIGPTTQRTACV